jgi:acyl-CoA hydrolase
MTGGRRPLVVYADGPDGPLPDPARLATLRDAPDAELLVGWTVRTPDWLASSGWPVTTLLAGTGMRRAVGAGRVRSVPARLSSVPGLLAGRLRPDVAVVGAVADGAGWRSIASVGWAPDAAAAARRVVVERWPEGAVPPGTPRIEGHVVEVVERTEGPDAAQDVTPSPLERAIAAQVATLVPEGATVQWGPGALGAAFVDALRVPVAVHSGVVTDELVGLADRGLLVGTAEAAYLWGGPALAALAAAGRVRLRPVGETHDLARLGSMAQLVAVNTALEVGLDGAANVEVVDGRVVSGPGGHPDFCLGAARSPGGLSVLAVRAAVRGRSCIVARPAVVSTPRTDIDVVVTEHGVADLRGLDAAGRAAALVAVADPAWRPALAAAAAAGPGDASAGPGDVPGGPGGEALPVRP